eukprot:3889580-Alexandrium_andersonii.AAC.1
MGRPPPVPSRLRRPQTTLGHRRHVHRRHILHLLHSSLAHKVDVWGVVGGDAGAGGPREVRARRCTWPRRHLVA